MTRPALEVADIFRAHGSAWRRSHEGHLSLGQLKVMSAIEQCRSAALGGHVLRCDACDQVRIAYNSCRNRHCPKCQARAARQWLEARQADLLPVEYHHVVFTLPAPNAAIAYTNKAVIYDLLFAVAAETLRTIAADPKHLGAEVGVTLVLHTWARRSPIIPMCTASYPAAVSPLTANAGCAADPVSSCRCVCCRACSVAAFSKNSNKLTAQADCSSSARTRRSQISRRSYNGLRRCALANGWSMPSAPLPDPRRYSPICPATHTASPSRIRGCLRSMSAASPFATKTIAPKPRPVTER